MKNQKHKGNAYLKELGRRLRAARVPRMTQQELSNRTGVMLCNISRIESGLVNISLVTLLQLCGGLGEAVSNLTAGLEGRAGEYLDAGGGI